MTTRFDTQHDDLEDRVRALRACSLTDDPVILHRQFVAFERDLRSHLAAEEDQLLAALAVDAPVDAFRIREHHAELRRRLESLGIEIELHAARLVSFDEIVQLVQHHAQLWSGARA